MSHKCLGCGKEIEGNAKIVIRNLVSYGYTDNYLHDKKCFKQYAKKKFKLLDY